MLSLTYISRASLHAPHRAESVAGEIARESAEANQELQVTGALIFTTSHFAQILEGPSQSIELLVRKIEKDRRHDLLRILDRRRIDARKFPEWSMAYAGGPVSLDQFIAKALSNFDEAAGNTELLCRLISQFAMSRSVQGKLRGIAHVRPLGSALSRQLHQHSNSRILHS